MRQQRGPLAKFGFALLALALGYVAAGCIYAVLEQVLTLLIISSRTPLGPGAVYSASAVGALLAWVYVGVWVYGKFTATSVGESKPALDADGKVAADWLDDVMRQVDTIFRTEKGLVAGLADGRALAPVDGRYKVFETLQGYRRAAKDEGQWQEISDAAAKSHFLAEARAGLAATAGKGE